MMFKMDDDDALAHLKFVEEIIIIYNDMIDQVRPDCSIPEFLKKSRVSWISTCEKYYISDV